MSIITKAATAETKHPANTLEQRSMEHTFEAAPEELRRRMGWPCRVIDGAMVSVAAHVRASSSTAPWGSA